MKKSLIAIGAAALILAACDDVPQDDRYIELPTLEVQKAVLIEDFTGQRCTNCPAAHRSIEQMEEQYGDAFIAVSIHSGAQSIPTSNTRYLGLATATGDLYDEAAGVAPHGYPSIIVDGNSSAIYVGSGAEWIAAAREAMTKTSVVALNVEAQLGVDAEGYNTIAISATALPAVDFSGKIQFWIVEDGIVAPQMGIEGISGFDKDYVHNNVFRAAANGDWGADITLERAVSATSSALYTLSSDWQKTWNVNNLKVVAFIYNDSDGVIQAARCKVAANLPTSLLTN